MVETHSSLGSYFSVCQFEKHQMIILPLTQYQILSLPSINPKILRGGGGIFVLGKKGNPSPRNFMKNDSCITLPRCLECLSQYSEDGLLVRV